MFRVLAKIRHGITFLEGNMGMPGHVLHVCPGWVGFEVYRAARTYGMTLRGPLGWPFFFSFLSGLSALTFRGALRGLVVDTLMCP
jgi:hypothetical protein